MGMELKSSPLCFYLTIYKQTKRNFMKKITINGKTYNFKQNLKAMIMYEKMTDKPFNITTFTDIITLMYCCIIASNEDDYIGFNEFLEALDNQPELLSELSDLIAKEQEKTTLLSGNEKASKKK